jgi:hypothetical protein
MTGRDRLPPWVAPVGVCLFFVLLSWALLAGWGPPGWWPP